MKLNILKYYVSVYGIKYAAYMLLAIGILGGLYGHITEYSSIRIFKLIEDYYTNFSTELIGIAITVLVLDKLYIKRQQRIENDRLKIDLMNRVRSQVNVQALSALEGLFINEIITKQPNKKYNFSGANLHQAHFFSYFKVEGAKLKGANFQDAILSEAWLNETDLCGANLSRVKLQKARLFKTNLQQTTLNYANFEGAYLFKVDLWNTENTKGVSLKNANIWDCNLFGANLNHSDLIHALRLRGTRMPGGQRYNGCYKLNGDIDDAKFDGVNLSIPQEMADWYVVSLEEYSVGQIWIKENLSRLHQELEQ